MGIIIPVEKYCMFLWMCTRPCYKTLLLAITSFLDVVGVTVSLFVAVFALTSVVLLLWYCITKRKRWVLLLFMKQIAKYCQHLKVKFSQLKITLIFNIYEVNNSEVCIFIWLQRYRLLLMGHCHIFLFFDKDSREAYKGCKYTHRTI